MKKRSTFLRRVGINSGNLLPHAVERHVVRPLGFWWDSKTSWQQENFTSTVLIMFMVGAVAAFISVLVNNANINLQNRIKEAAKKNHYEVAQLVNCNVYKEADDDHSSRREWEKCTVKWHSKYYTQYNTDKGDFNPLDMRKNEMK